MADTVQARLKRVGPQIRPAGFLAQPDEWGVKELTSSYHSSGRKTPPVIQKFHHRGPEVDEITRHWGLANDPRADREKRYGRVVPNADGVDPCLRPMIYADKMSTLIGEEREKRFESNVRRPLGRAPDPSFPLKIPPKGFGMTVQYVDTCKGIINNMKDVEPMHAPGEQYSRGYDWDKIGINFEKHRFGKVTARGESATECFRQPNETKIVRKTVTDYNSTVKAEVGKPKSYGFDNPEEWPSNKNGKNGKTIRPRAENYFQRDQPTIKEMIGGWAVGPVNEQRPEWATEEGSRRYRPGGAWERRNKNQYYPDRPNNLLCRIDGEGEVHRNGYGRDILVLDNLEDGVTVPQLIHPCHYVTRGIASRYFAGGRDLEDIRSLCKKCNFGMTDDQIDTVFVSTAKNGLCGIEQFKNEAKSMGFI